LDKKEVTSNHEFARLYGIPLNVNREIILTGQVMFQKAADKPPPGDGTDRVLMAVFGIVAVPKDSIKDHLQYPVVGTFDATIFDDLKIDIDLDQGVKPDIPETKGLGIAGLLKSSIWKV
jgi:hypothetical protein